MLADAYSCTIKVCQDGRGTQLKIIAKTPPKTITPPKTATRKTSANRLGAAALVAPKSLPDIKPIWHQHSQKALSSDSEQQHDLCMPIWQKAQPNNCCMHKSDSTAEATTEVEQGDMTAPSQLKIVV
jgi:hypothetical protein